MSRLAMITAAALVSLSSWGLGCQSIAGIEDRTYEPGLQGSAECEAYCDSVMAACTGTHAAYPTRDQCIATCATLPSGEAQNDNSLECRSTQAAFAQSSTEPEIHCPAAGPFGVGVCGSLCQSYCTLLEAACPNTMTGITDCEKLCGGLRSDGKYDLGQLASGDNVECRIARASAALLDSKTHCSSAAMKSTECADPSDGTPSCADTCQLVTTACSGADAVYESEAQCLAVCGKLDAGTNADQVENTVGCRKYHGYNSLAAPAQHCPHTGPGGDGHCGADNCEGYCQLLARTCDAELKSTYGDEATCLTECAKLPGSKADSYSDAAKTGNTVRCRLINVARAAEDPAQHCAAAAGGGECQ